MLHEFAEQSQVSRDNQHMQIEQRLEACTSRVLADGLVTRNQILNVSYFRAAFSGSSR